MVTQTRMSLADFLALPETKPYREFVRGEVVPKPMPNDYHSEMVAEVIFVLKLHQRDHPGIRVDTELRHISREEQRVYLPDVSLTRVDRLPATRENPITVAPDMVIEVLSPDDRAGEVLDKVDFYLRIGVRLTWIVDPEGEAVTVYRAGEAPRVYRAPEVLGGAPVLDGFEVPLETLFAGLAPEEAPES